MRSTTAVLVLSIFVGFFTSVDGAKVIGRSKKKTGSSSLVDPNTSNDKKRKKRILSFGGNGMIGSETLDRLIKTDEYDITLVSRGSWPFDSGKRIAPYVRNIICDRKAGIETCHDLLEEIQSTDQYYAVLGEWKWAAYFCTATCIIG